MQTLAAMRQTIVDHPRQKKSNSARAWCRFGKAELRLDHVEAGKDALLKHL